MAMIDRTNISQLTCGIRFEKSFRISDITGSLFDTVLHHRSSPFGTDFFPRFHELDSQNRVLVNVERGYYLRITTSDIIFQYTIFPDTKDLDGEIAWFRKDAVEFILKELIAKNRIRNLMRFGFMISHSVGGENLGGNVLDQLTSGEIKNADQFTFRFGNKDTTADALTKKGVDDYVNRITTIKQTGEADYEVVLDYQYYFVPPLPNADEWSPNPFFDRAMDSLDSKFYRMINPLLSKMVAVA